MYDTTYSVSDSVNAIEGVEREMRPKVENSGTL